MHVKIQKRIRITKPDPCPFDDKKQPGATGEIKGDRKYSRGATGLLSWAETSREQGDRPPNN